MEHFTPAPPAAVTRALMQWDRKTLAAFIAVAIDLMDVADGDPDEERDPFNEGEPAFDPVSRALVNEKDLRPGDALSGDAEPGAWREWHAMSALGKRGPNCNYGHEDDEEDDPQGEVTDDDPAFSKRDLAIANRSASGPGCSISDSDYCPTELGERDDANCAPDWVYGVDQSREVGPDNPPFSDRPSAT